MKELFFITRSLSGGGAERVISNLACHFSQREYQVTLICLDKQEIKYNLATAITVRQLVKRNSSNSLFFRIYYAILTFIRLLQIIAKQKPYCCISFMTSVNVWTGLCCILLNRAYIVSERTSPHYSIGRLKGLKKWFTFKIYQKAKVVVLPSKKMIACFAALKYFKNLRNLVAIYNPVHVFSSTVKETVYPKNFILSVGRLDQDKGFEQLIEAFYLLSHLDIDLLISGTGPHKSVLEQKVAKLGLQARVKFIGFKNDLQEYYSKAKLFVLASKVEGYPNALIEAMSLGCPVVSTDCDFGPSEIIKNGHNGFLVEIGDRKQLADAMYTLINNIQLSEKFSINGLQINHSNSLENIARKWNNIIIS